MLPSKQCHYCNHSPCTSTVHSLVLAYIAHVLTCDPILGSTVYVVGGYDDHLVPAGTLILQHVGYTVHGGG